MLIDSSRSNPLDDSSTNRSSKTIAALTAIAVTGLLLAGYFYTRNRFRTSVAVPPDPVAVSNAPKGPAKVHVLVDDPTLKGGATTLAGTVKNISQQHLSG